MITYMQNEKDSSMVYIAADHAGYAKKEYLKKYFEAHGILFQDLGAHTFK